MTDSAGPSHWEFECREVGFPCEWRLRAGSVAEVEARFREHAKCAHQSEHLSDDLAVRVRAATRPV